jgi:hypothetical protein
MHVGKRRSLLDGVAPSNRDLSLTVRADLEPLINQPAARDLVPRRFSGQASEKLVAAQPGNAGTDLQM